jgi:ATP-dependent Clp protease protease subunit
MSLSKIQQRFERFQRSRQAFDPGAKSWYRMAQQNRSAEIYIYDGIGLFGVEAESFINDLSAIDADEITLRINSPGGNVFDGTAIYNALLRHSAKVSVKIDGLAASMASIIALAGDEVEMAENAFFMIHMPWSLVIGDSDDMRKEAEILDKLAQSAIDVYEKRSTLSRDDVVAAMKDETWYSAQEAMDAGFVNSIFSGDKEEMRFDLSVFEHAPQGASSPREPKADPRGLEEILRRDGGMSQKEAKKYIADYNRNRDGGGSSRDDEELIRLRTALTERSTIFQ